MRGASATVAAEEPSTRRKKKAATAVGMRAWLVLDSSGRTQVVEAGKHAIMRRTGLPARDLRIMDPVLSYPSTVLGRERAIVINLEHIKAIITAQELLLLNFKDPSVLPFVDQLHTLILRRHQALNSQESGENENANRRNLHDSSEEREQEGEDDGQYGQHAPTPNLVPFEFVALEACLDAACTCLNNEASTLEQEAHPALDKLTTKISTLNLDRVRQIKSRLVAITGRAQKVRDELEHLLDDDGDMAEMYLTEKLEDSSISSIHAQDESDEEIMGGSNNNNDSNVNTRHLRTRTIKGLMESNEDDSITSDPPHDNEQSRDHQLFVITRSRSAISKRFDVQELEMLLEAYFVQIEGTLNKLSALREYVDDTEDYINIMMDDKQNHLLKLGVMVATATMVISAFVVVVGILGMNIRIYLFKDTVHGMNRFLWTVGGCTAGCVFLYVTAIFWWKRKGLLH